MKVWCLIMDLELLLIGIFCIVFGGFLFLKPKLIWKLTEQWKSNYADEPSSLYKASTKFGGICFLVLGIIAVFLFLLI